MDSSISDITISGDIGGKSIYYAVVNTLSTDISSAYVRYIDSGSRAESRALAQMAEVVSPDRHESNEEQFHCYHGYEFKPNFERNSSKSIASNESEAKSQLSYRIGATVKKIYAATAPQNYELKDATLWAFNDTCNVWILNDDRYLRAEKQKREIAEIYAQRFAAMYPLIRSVFGEESDALYTSVYGGKSHMNSASDTGTKVNIVVYDLFNDRNFGDTIGFFSSMDYYKNGLQFSNVAISHSNEGKYFYIDSYRALRNFNCTLSTLAHEFQHMINFNMKTMQGVSCDQNFNEMLSMLCEDMMQEFLNIDDSQGPKNRLGTFMSRYYESGIREYSDTDPLSSYANAYAFGAWLTQRYGGTDFIKEMMRNGKANNACIASAVNSVNGTAYSFNDIFAEFITACFGDDSFSAHSAVRESPAIFANMTVRDMPADYGMLLKSWGEIEQSETSVHLSFNSNSGKTNSGLLLYLYVR